jgi:hypothetical protein
VSVTPPVKIRIIRKGNGQVIVYPPLTVIGAGDPFTMINTTGEPATVAFDSDVVRPQRHTITPKAPHTFTAGAGPDYVEYDVQLASGFRAEGNSRPGAIIDP